MNAHNALNDVFVLQKLLKKICDDNTIIVQNTKSIEFMLHSKIWLQQTKENNKSLLDLKISKAMKGKFSKADINKTITQQAFVQTNCNWIN